MLLDMKMRLQQCESAARYQDGSGLGVRVQPNGRQPRTTDDVGRRRASRELHRRLHPIYSK